VEIERKFRVRPGWQPTGSGTRLEQGYLCLEPARTVRVRRADGQAWLTIKGRSVGARRAEFEYPIPVADAEAMLALCAARIEKTRYRLPHGRHVFEVDVFAGRNAGLILAEVELGHEDERFERPDWLGTEVTADPRYFNSALATHPYSDWSDR
jgi:adenylate cyclase